jgi:hypothetical protein
MPAFRRTLHVLTLLCSGLALASAAGPFPQLQIVNEACETIGALAAGDTLRVTYQNVAQSCAGGRCSVLVDEPLDASVVQVQEKGGPVTGVFVSTGQACAGHPVWRFEGALPREGDLALLLSPNTSYGTIPIRSARHEPVDTKRPKEPPPGLPDPCVQPATFIDGRETSESLPLTSFDWSSREIGWDDLHARFPVASRTTLWAGADLRVELVLGNDQLALVVGRRQGGPWCATATWSYYFGGRGLDVRTAEIVAVAGDLIVLLDTQGMYSSPEGAAERDVSVLRIDAAGRIGERRCLELKVAGGERTELAVGEGGVPRLLIHRTPPVDVYDLGSGLKPHLRRRGR